MQHDLTDSYRVEGLLLYATTTVHTNRVLTNELTEGSGDCDNHRVFLLANVTTLRSLYAIAIPSVVCLSSVVCDVGAPYSGG